MFEIVKKSCFYKTLKGVLLCDSVERTPVINFDGRRAQKKKGREGGEVPRVFRPVEHPFHENNRKLLVNSDISQETDDDTKQHKPRRSSSQYEYGTFDRKRKIKLRQTNRIIENDAGGDDIDDLLFDKNKLHLTRIIRQLGGSTRQHPPSPTPSEDNKKNDVEEFLSPYSVTKQMKRILASFPNINVTIDTLGRTTEFNDIVLFKIISLRDRPTFRSQKYAEDMPEKKILFIVHGLTVMGLNSLSCLTEEYRFKILLGYYLEHLNVFNIYLIPVANPDGYAATNTKTYWNKNSSPQSDCNGVNLDRNFDVMWNASHGLSSCSQLYPGPAPFSEAETRAVRDVFHYHSHKIAAYIHVHSGSYDTSSFKGDAILYPRGYTNVPSDDDKYVDIKGEVDEAMRNASFRVLSVAVDTLNHWYGKVTGTSVDYASTVYGIPYAMEFVMQLYEPEFFASQDEEMYDYGALTEVWRRLINVVFKQLAKSVDFKPAVDSNSLLYKRAKRGKRIL